MTDAALAASGVALRSSDLIALRQVALRSDSRPVLAALPGGFATKRKGHGLEVADMREYVAGDDIRHLDRGTTARTGRLHVRQFQQERDRVTLLVADMRSEMFWGLRRAFRSVAAAEVLSLIGWNVVETSGRVGLLAITPTEPVIVPPRGRFRAMLDVIGGLVQAHEDALASIRSGSDGETNLDQALSRVDRLVPSGAELIIASGFDAPGAGFADRLDSLARRRVPRLIMITDAEAATMPKGRYPIRLPNGQHLRVHLGDPENMQPRQTQLVENWNALTINAGDTVQETARRLAAAFPADRAA